MGDPYSFEDMPNWEYEDPDDPENFERFPGKLEDDDGDDEEEDDEEEE